MKSYFTSFLIFCLIVLNAIPSRGQDIEFFGEMPSMTQKDNDYTCYQWNKPRNWDSRREIDTSILSVSYDFSFTVPEEDNNKKVLKDTYRLQIGSEVNRYFSEYSERRDSIALDVLMQLPDELFSMINSDWIPGSSVRRRMYGWIPEGICPLYNDIYSYPKESKRTVSSRFQNDEYRYEEPIDDFHWELLSDSEEYILNFPCNKAKAEYRGRTWIVWYTLDIPYRYGPWKFYGLPGLILKAVDSDSLFCWEAVGMDNTQHESICDYLPGISKNDKVKQWIGDNKVRTCSRKEMERLWKRFWNAPLTIQILDKSSATYSDGEKEMIVRVSDPIPDLEYPQLELDL